MEQYLQAFGLAITLGADKNFAHLFARGYDATTNASAVSMQKAFKDFSSHPHYVANNTGEVS